MSSHTAATLSGTSTVPDTNTHCNCVRIQARGTERRLELTLGLGKLALLNTGLDSLVELRIESGLRRDVEFVVRGHILLDRLAAVTQKARVSVIQAVTTNDAT